MTKITDWIDATNGLRYGYDDGGRLTSITDYDDSSLTYAYDAAGNLTSMTDYPFGWSFAKPVGRQRLQRSEVARATGTRRRTRTRTGTS